MFYREKSRHILNVLRRTYNELRARMLVSLRTEKCPISFDKYPANNQKTPFYTTQTQETSHRVHERLSRVQHRHFGAEKLRSDASVHFRIHRQRG